MRKSKSPPLLSLLFAVLALFAFGTFSAWADDVVVTATTDSLGTDTACPPSCATTGTTTETTAYANVTPNGPTPRKAKMGILTTSAWEVQPTVADGAGIYKIYVAKGTTGSCYSNLRIACSAVSGISQMRDTNGVVQTSIITPYFSKDYLNNWYPVGEITASSTSPRIRFAYSSGGFSRFYMDAVRFQLKDACTDPVVVAPKPSVTGPMTAGATTVTVLGVSATATNVTVYDKTTLTIIGTLYNPAGLTAGQQVVTTTALVKNHVIQVAQYATNSLGSCYSGYSDATPKVGGGANQKLNLVLGAQTKAGLTGPAGTPVASPGTGTLYWVHCTGTVNGVSATGPVGGYNITPSTCWETYSFDIVNDPCRNWLGNTDYNEPNQFAVMDSLVFGIDMTDANSGPYDIYIDNIRNGSVVLADFENQADGTPNVAFANPVTGASPPSSYFLSQPNSAVISQVNKIEGTNSLRVRWQYSGTDPILWTRLLMNQAPYNNPQLDRSQPITVSVLVLPVGETTGSIFSGTVSDLTNSAGPFYQNGTATVGATVTGVATPVYSWFQSDGLGGWNDLGVNTQTMTVNPLPAFPATSVTYRFGVNDGGCTVYKTITLPLTVSVPVITVQPVSAAMNAGGAAPISVSAVDGPFGDSIQYYTWYQGTDERDIATFTSRGSSYTSGNLGDIITSAAGTDSGFYYCAVQGLNGFATSKVVSLLVVPSGAGSGTGLRGEYYNQAEFTSGTIPGDWGTVDFTRTDPEVNFMWGNNIMDPAPGIQQDWFFVRWSGTITPLASGAHDFIIRSDDGCRLWIDGTLVQNNLIAKGNTEVTNSYTFADTNPKSILMEYMEIGGDADVQLIWRNAGDIVKTFVPPQQLTPAGTAWAPPTITLATPVPNSLTLPGTVDLSATVTTNNGFVKQVEFYNGTTLIGTATTETAGAWVYTGWAPPAGNLTVTAKVVFNVSEKVASAGQAVTVTPAAPTAGANTPVCEGATLNLTASAQAGGTYAWTGPNGFASALQNPSIPNVTLAAAGTYSVTVTVDGLTSAAGSTPAVVVTARPATPTANATPNPVTVGGTLDLSTPTVAGVTYAWTGPNSFSSALQNPSIPSVTTAAAGTYSVTLTDTTTGCASAPGTVAVTVISLLPVTITSIVNNGDGTITISYSGGAGSSFTLLKSADVTSSRATWTAVTGTTPANPSSSGTGSFQFTPAGNEFYAIQSQ